MTVYGKRLTREQAVAWFDRACDCEEVVLTDPRRVFGTDSPSSRGRLRRAPEQEGCYYLGAESEPRELVPGDFRWANVADEEPSPSGFLGYTSLTIGLPIGDGTEGAGILVQRVE